jgi:hypothetical protein
MNTCDTCKHWTNGECSNRKLGLFSSDTDGLAAYDSDENIACTIETGPKFGCIHWEAKE